jgi:hypothetical protein
VARAVTYGTTVIIRLDAAAGCWGRGCSLGHGGRAKQVSADSLTQFGPGIVSESRAFHGKIAASHVGFRPIEFAAENDATRDCF